MELVDSLREMSVGLTEIFMTQVSHRTNEIMKVLTLMASIFIPLTFMAGIYGMNFENMPELNSRWGYPLLLGAMFAVAGVMLGYFRRRGWIGRSPVPSEVRRRKMPACSASASDHVRHRLSLSVSGRIPR